MSWDDEFSSTIAVRAYTVHHDKKTPTSASDDIPTGAYDDDPDEGFKRFIGYSDWSLTLAAETTTDEFQNLRFGVFQLRQLGEIDRCGIFFDDRTLTPADLHLLKDYCVANRLELLSKEEFVEEIFFNYVYDLDALCIGFNLPFILSRLAIDCAPARRFMHGGFSFKLSPNRKRPRLRIKLLENGAAFIQFAGIKTDLQVPSPRGYFVDDKTLASALLGRLAWSLKSLAKHLRTPTQKRHADGDGQALTKSYLDCAMTDVQVTWECFEKLRIQYESFCLSDTPVNEIYSVASIGKAYLKQMGVKPLLEKQPDFSPEILGQIMSAYYGGRAEVHIRCQCVQVVYTDFLSMYPTVCILQGLWPFVIAQRIDVEDATAYVKDLLSQITIDALQTADFWKELRVLVQILPQGDILPVRAPYSLFSHELSTGVNYLTYHKPMWFTLADCIASTLLTGKPPEVIKAIRFVPNGKQEGLNPIHLCGNPEYKVDPATDDFYKRLIDLRNDVKAQMWNSRSDTRNKLDVDQFALKICASATSYGILLELNADDHHRNQDVTCYGYDASFASKVKSVENPGRYFNPLLGVLITGAARLMLAITESLATAEGLNWAFCDTDSMALAKPDEMTESDFYERVLRVRQWFKPLSPYKTQDSLLKIEAENFDPRTVKYDRVLASLFCWAVSAKRYVLFNRDESGEPIIRKVTEHALGNLFIANAGDDEPARGISGSANSTWEPFWYRIAKAALDGHHAQVALDDLPILDGPAVSRYTANNPTLLGRFKKRNDGREYRKQVKPFNSFFVPRRKVDLGEVSPSRPSPVAPYDSNIEKALSQCYDSKTDCPIYPSELKSCKEALAQFHLHPENKFSNADYLDTGETRRRHVIATAIEHIGKESNRLEEQWYTGPVEDAQIHYGYSPSDIANLVQVFKAAALKFGQPRFAETADLSVVQLRRVLKGQSPPSRKVIVKLQKAIRILEENARLTRG